MTSIDWEDDVGTVYVGYIDIVKGELVEEQEYSDQIIHQLTPEAMRPLKGDNSFWTNTDGDITVKYWTH